MNDKIKTLNIVNNNTADRMQLAYNAVANFDIPIVFKEEIKNKNDTYFVYERSSYYYLVRDKDSKILLFTDNYELILGKIYQGDLSDEK